MTTNTLTTEQRRNVALFSSVDSMLGLPGQIQHEWKKGPNNNDVLVLKNVPVFRSGSFSDSQGRKHDWTDADIIAMRDNYNILRSSNVFPDVPIRADHPSFMGGSIIDKVIGYHGALSVDRLTSEADGFMYTYLLADLDIIREDAQQAILNGLWRSRSAEVGEYKSNSGVSTFPAYMGGAYVDMPAVEGLKQHLKNHSKPDNNYSLMMEDSVTQVPNPALVPPAVPQVHTFSLPGQSAGAQTTDFAKVQATLDSQFTMIGNLQGEIAAKDTEINTLRAFQADVLVQNRTDFVNGLAAKNQILQTQVEATIEFCKGMSPEQFESYSKLMDVAPVAPILGQYGQQPMYGAPGAMTPPQAPGSPQHNAAEARKADLVEQIKMHRASGTAASKVMTYSSFQELKGLDESAATMALA